MLISEAQQMIGKIVDVTFGDKRSEEQTVAAEVFDVCFVSLAGPCLITDVGEIRLDRVHSWAEKASPIRKAA